MCARSLFQPTRPLRGATVLTLAQLESGMVISTHAPLAGRDVELRIHHFAVVVISTHAPLAGRDNLHPAFFDTGQISTHAPLAGRDRSTRSPTTTSAHFNPRAPCGARQMSRVPLPSRSYFNPRAPCGARLFVQQLKEQQQKISTHAPLAGRDAFPVSTLSDASGFQPTRPLRGATVNHDRWLRG